MGSLDAQDVASLDDCQAARTVKLLALSAASSRSSWRLSPSGSGTAVNCKPIRKAMGSTIRNISGAIRGVQVRGERAEQDAFRGEASPTAMASSLVVRTRTDQRRLSSRSSRIALSRSKSFWFALRIDAAIIGAAILPKPLGSPAFRSVMRVPPDSVSCQE